ncbi:cell adhesion molecule L1-like a isoform X1 [Myripristis murdjan]|uniref:cell adhesion molecule L1-like a isoform X1 n=1 Tax=Myripristis murdjan TaxID=586833 RepID=UPI0011763B8B|nr:neural cell adhesion molecule L1-like protein isoform X1 [Myripristis murdjan]
MTKRSADLKGGGAMRSPWSLGLALLLALISRATCLDIPLEVEQPPTITSHTPSPVIVLPIDDDITMRCEARGNPPPVYRWTRDGEEFIPPYIPTKNTDHSNGNFVLYSRHRATLQGKYRCYASNKLGTAMTEEIELMIPRVPRFPKEVIGPVVVDVGQPVILKCNPPEGVAPREIYWMSIGLQHIEQDERVSMGNDGNLYFSNALETDSRQDYCCYASFATIRTIVQKTPMTVIVKSLKPDNESDNTVNSTIDPPMRIPNLLVPPGVQTEVVLIKGKELELECIAEGFPTPKVEWIKMGEHLPARTKIKNYGKLLTISKIEKKDYGKYMCRAENTAGATVHYFDVIVEEPPKWRTEPPQGQLVVVGSDISIKCSVLGIPPPDITWKRNGEILKDEPSNRILVLDDTVLLHNARPEDTGVYQCEVSNTHGSLLANVNIMVMTMGPLMLTRDKQEYAVVQGGDIIMNCSVFSSPPPEISWAKDETPGTIEGERFSVHRNGSLQIISAEKEDSGEYECSAINTEGKSAVTAVLEVKDSTKIRDPPQDMQIISGTTAQLRCQVDCDDTLVKTLEMIWLKDGEEIPLAFMENFKYLVGVGMLQIMNVNQSDQGVYTCIAKTSLDQTNASATLTVLDIPDAPVEVEMSEQKGRSVRLSWTPGSDHNSTVTEFIVEFEENQWEPGRWKELQKVPGNQATAELALHGHLSYQFRVYAVNAIGPGPPSEPTERFRTLPTGPDRNPENIKIQGHLPHQMEISWEPLLPIEHNGPGLEYKVSYRRLGLGEVWKEHLVRRHLLVVKNTPTFVPYEVKVQSKNGDGWGPEPKIVTGYSGEDVPTAAPRNVAVEVINTTVLRVSWTPVPLETVRGHLEGYNVHWLRTQSLLYPSKGPGERRSLSFPGNRSHGIVPGLKPYSEYNFTVNVFNKKGNGPHSDLVSFHTPEGVPEQVPILTASNAQTDSISLVWGPPLEAHGILIGYLLQYQLVNETTKEVGDSQEMNITGPDTTHWQIEGLEEGSLYRFHLSACTRVGCGPPLAQEGNTLAQAHLSLTPAVAPAQSIPALLNISSYVSDTFAKISWTAREEQQDSQLYVAYMNNRDGNWWISEAVNTSQSFHVINGLKPGTVYTVRLMAKGLLDNASIFEDVIQTRVKGVAGSQSSISTQGWLIGTMCAVALLTLIALIACFVRKNKGGKYAGTLPPPQRPDMFSMDQVKEKEDLHPDVESQGMNDDTFCEYSDSDEKPLKGNSLCSLNGDDMGGDSVSRDSLVDYADGEGEFDEDGSFIGEYSARKHRGSVAEPTGPVTT